jgi:hypothetical protein
MGARTFLPVIAFIVALSVIASACGSDVQITTTSVPVTIQQDPSGRIHESAVTCKIVQMTGFQVVVATGIAKNISRSAVYVSPQASFNNREGEELTDVGADSAGVVRPLAAWRWKAQEPVVPHAGVKDLNVVQCVIMTFVTS